MAHLGCLDFEIIYLNRGCQRSQHADEEQVGLLKCHAMSMPEKREAHKVSGTDAVMQSRALKFVFGKIQKVNLAKNFMQLLF